MARRSHCGFALLLAALAGCGGAGEPATELAYVADAARHTTATI